MRVKVTRYDQYPYNQDEAPWVIVEAKDEKVALHAGKILLRDIPASLDAGLDRRLEWSTRVMPDIVVAPLLPAKSEVFW